MQILSKKTENTAQPVKNEGLIRPRLNKLLAQAIKKPLTVVCAGMGCGKTQAVYDFSRECGMPIAWMKLSESDNIGTHFWENFIRSISQTERFQVSEYKRLGFPNTEDKLERFFSIRSHEAEGTRYTLVFDDIHHLKSAEILSFFEKALNNKLDNRSIILISREYPKINISSMVIGDEVSFINEEELNFTEGELYHFLVQQGLIAETSNLSRIYGDTKGWALIINFVVRMLKKTPGYAGYVQSAIKQNIFQLIKAENWDTISEPLRHLFLRISLTDHRSSELIELLAGRDASLITELRQQNAFVSFNKHIDYYNIHQLYMEFLCARQSELTDEETRDSYKIIADWCLNNDFTIDALLDYEKFGDYQSIMNIISKSTATFLVENAKDIVVIFDRIKDSVFDEVEQSAAIHVMLVMSAGRVQETIKLLAKYEEKYLSMPEGNVFRNRMLGCLYYQWSIYRMMMCTVDDCYDFDSYLQKAFILLKDYPVQIPGNWYQHPPGMWTCLAGSNRVGALHDFLYALTRSKQYMDLVDTGLCAGLDDLCQGELMFYQGHINQAEFYFRKALGKARGSSQFEIIWRVLFYLLRISVSQGSFRDSELVLKDMEDLLEADNNTIRFLFHDIIMGWYQFILDQPDKIPYWLKGETSHLIFYTNSLENSGNHIKAKYCYLTKNYSVLLDYIGRKKVMNIVLYERVEILAMEACVRYDMKDKNAAFLVLKEAYDMASPNDIVMPFIEFGKDMRKLLVAAINDNNCGIPLEWLKSIKQKVFLFIKNQASVIYKYKRASEFDNKIILSPRETEILRYMCEGSSRTEIADKLAISVNTIKVHINSIYEKLNAHNRADIFRIAIEQGLI